MQSPDNEKTEVLTNPDDIDRATIRTFSRIQHNYDACTDAIGPTVAMGVEGIKKLFLNAYDRGVKIRFIAEVTKDNLPYCKQIMEIAELRHLDGVLGNFGVSETDYLAAATLYKEKPLSMLIYSNAKQIVKQQQFIFQTLWNRAIPADQRIRELEEGVEPEFMEVITDTARTSDLMLTLVKSAKKEVLFLLPNDTSLIRMDKLGVVNVLGDASNRRREKVKVRGICPFSNKNSEVVNWILNQTSISLIDGREAQTGIIIIDGTIFLSVESVNPTSDKFSNAIGIALYSNSKRTINLFESFFNALWENSEMVQKLKAHDRMQREFINIAAHELRTPVQPILGLAEILESQFVSSGEEKGQNQIKVEVDREDLKLIVRNAKRLERLSSDILEIARIESGNLKLNVEEFDLADDVIKPLVEDAKRNTNGNKKKDITIQYFSNSTNHATTVQRADKNRIAQVISNLIDNAIKFTEKGRITVYTETKDGAITVTVKDEGLGIDSAIIPKLFTKFATKSEKGIGLGLYISKNIIEAHGGKIWAENNADGKGATFMFTLPLSV